jgi:hypothetical protein
MPCADPPCWKRPCYQSTFRPKDERKKSVAERTPYVGHYSLNQCTWELVGVALPVGCRLQFLGSSWLWFVSGDRELDLKQP